MPSHALLLLNPGARQGQDCREEVLEHLGAFGVTTIEANPDDPSGLGEVIRRHRHEVDRVVVGGGDGTLNGALQGLVGTELPLALLPLGTANNLARTLGIPTALREACEIAALGRRRRIDLGWVNGHYFFTTASLGLSVRITEELTGESKRRWGPLAYGVAAARVLSRSHPFHAEIRYDGKVLPTRTVQIVVGNGRYYGAALAVAEDAAIDDARLDLYSLQVRHWWELLALVPALKWGRHGRKDSVEALRSTEFEIRTRTPKDIDVDGEIGARTPARFRVMPGALEVLVPLAERG